MDGIFQMNQPFDFSNLTLLSPAVTAGGNYFIKFRVNNNPLYIQPPKCKTKQGIYKSGKKYFCDLIFTNDNESFIHWMDNLENHARKVIYENKAKWFETDLDENDIENSFTSPLKWVKSGKFYICRVNIPTTLGNCSLKVYNEEESEIPIESIQENQNVMTILEIQGIKCSAKSFQIDIEIKQMLVMKPDNLFDKCILKSNKANPIYAVDKQIVVEKQLPPPSKIEESLSTRMMVEDPSRDLENIVIENHEETSIEQPLLEDAPIEETKDAPQLPPTATQTITIDTDMAIPKNMEIEEIQFDLDNLPSNDVVQIKKRNDVYYEMYKEAKKKAKIARDLAISSYLEAKQIKQTYLLRSNEDSDSDSGLDDDFFQIKE